MSNFEEIMDKHIQSFSAQEPQENSNPVSGQGESTEPVSEGTAPASAEGEPVQESKAEAPEGKQVEPAEQPEAKAETPTEPTVDYGKFLEENSGGLFKTVDEFKSALDKVKGYDELQAKIDELENKNPFANDYVAKLNRLYAEGKTQDQIDAFNSLQKLGDISQMDPFEVKVQRLVFEGYPRATAERQVKSQFGLDINVNEDELTDEELAANKIKLEDAQIALKISSREDAAFLQQQLARISESDDDKQTRILQEAAAKEAYEKKLTPFVNQLASSYEQGVKVPVKTNDIETEYKFDFDDNFRMDIAKMAKEFFTDNPVNDENVRSFKDFANAQYVASKLKTDIIPNAVSHGYALGYKKATEEFENKSGLPTQQDAPLAANPNAELSAQMRKVAMGEE